MTGIADPEVVHPSRQDGIDWVHDVFCRFRSPVLCHVPDSRVNGLTGFLLRSHQDKISGSAAVLDTSAIQAENGEGVSW